MKYRFLDEINSPLDIKKLNSNEIGILASEIREFLIDRTSENGGHLASNLGVVELTLAIHSVFDSPSDHIIFDVGHQSYVHKILTGRKDDFVNLRKPGGLSGFTSMSESAHDPFGAGHSSTSLSAALGYAEADRLSDRTNHTVCVVGDGALSGGMIHEALNNCKKDLPMVIILNENGMSISSTRGAFASYLSRVRASEKYRNFKRGTKNLIDSIPLIGRPIHRLCSLAKKIVKGILYRPNYFEELGLYYIGPVDGHDYDRVCKSLRLAKQTGKTCVVHVKTVKGKGYSPAESSPDGYHSVILGGDRRSFHSSLAGDLIEMAGKDDKIIAITAAMGIGTGLNSFEQCYPERYFDVGIAESHALTFAAGMAASGYKPYVAIYSTFLQRGYDNLLHDIALQGLPVRLLIDRAGLAACDGPTHHGIFDVSFISHIPDVILVAPSSYLSLKEFIDYSKDCPMPIAIRYPNGSEHTELLRDFKQINSDPLCRAYIDFSKDDVPDRIFITYGGLIDKVCAARDILCKEGIRAGIILLETLKPYDRVANSIIELVSASSRVLYAEEGIRNGGAAECLRSELIELGLDVNSTKYCIAAIDDNFAAPKAPCDIYDHVGLSAEKLASIMRE